MGASTGEAIGTSAAPRIVVRTARRVKRGCYPESMAFGHYLGSSVFRSVVGMETRRPFRWWSALLPAVIALAVTGGAPVRAQTEGDCGTTSVEPNLVVGQFALDPAGIQYVVAGPGILGIDPADGSTVVSIATPAIDVALHPSGDILSLEPAAERVARFAADGTPRGQVDVGRINTGESSVAADGSGRIWVADPFTASVRAFEETGALALTLDATPAFVRPADIEIGPDGKVFVLDGFVGVIYSFGSDGTPLATIPTGPINTGEADLAVDTIGRLYVVDPYTDTLRVFSPTGEPLVTLVDDNFDPMLVRTRYVEASPDGAVLVADTFTDQVYRAVVPNALGAGDIELSATAVPTAVSVGGTVDFVLTIEATGDCPIGPFQASVTAPPELPVALPVFGPAGGPEVPVLSPDEPPIASGVSGVAEGAGNHVIEFRTAGHGLDRTTDVTVQVPPPATTTTTTTTPTATTVPDTVDELPATGPVTVVWAWLATAIAGFGLFMVLLAHRPADGARRSVRSTMRR